MVLEMRIISTSRFSAESCRAYSGTGVIILKPPELPECRCVPERSLKPEPMVERGARERGPVRAANQVSHSPAAGVKCRDCAHVRRSRAPPWCIVPTFPEVGCDSHRATRDVLLSQQVRNIPFARDFAPHAERELSRAEGIRVRRQRGAGAFPAPRVRACVSPPRRWLPARSALWSRAL